MFISDHLFLTFFIHTVPLGGCSLLTPHCWQFLASLLRPLGKDLLLFLDPLSGTHYHYPSEKHSVLQLLKQNLRLIFFQLPRWPSGKASTSRAEDHEFESRLLWDFFGVESYQWLKNWHSSGYPARRLALKGQRWDWSARWQYTVTGWGRKSDLQLLSQCGST